jgi:nucleotide-binding universal stress UspA family protein
MLTRRRGAASVDTAAAGQRGRPVLLATLGVPYEEEAAALAVDAAVESGEPLVLVNVVEIMPLPGAVILKYGDVDDSPEDAAALLAPAELAHSLGVAVERLRVRTPHPVDALIEVVAERSPGLLVFGPDRRRLRGRVYRKAAKAVRERAGCLVWLAP